MSISSDTTPVLSTDSYNPDRLIAGDNAVSQGVTILSGQNLSRGAVVGRITASGKYILSLAAASDGSEVPRAIIAVDINATSGDKPGQVYVQGEFNERSLIFGTGHTAATVREPLRTVVPKGERSWISKAISRWSDVRGVEEQDAAVQQYSSFHIKS